MLSRLFPRWSYSDLITWSLSATVLVVSYLWFPNGDLMSLFGSLIGITALIYIAKGALLGQILSLAFCLFYGLKSLHFQYYGETLTYLGMSAPAAVFNLCSWIRHPYRGTKRVEVRNLPWWRFLVTAALCAGVTTVFYFLLKALGTAELPISTFSVSTSFFAAALSFQRSPWYAIAYVVNDVVLIALWSKALIQDPSVIPVLMCFVVFLFNDVRGFLSWRRMLRMQEEDLKKEKEEKNTLA